MGVSLAKTTLISFVLILSLQFFSAAGLAGQDLPLLTLDECIERGLKNDPDMVRAEANITQTNNNLWTNYGAFLPSVSTGFSYSRNHDSNTDEDSKGYGTSLSVNQNIFNGFSDYFSLRASRQTKMAQQNSYEGQVLTTVYIIKTGYYDVLRTMRLADVQRKALERSQEQLRITETRYELGSAALSDVLKAKVSMGEARLNLINAENNYKISSANLNYLIGADIEKQYRVDSSVIVREASYTLDNSLVYAQEHNPILQYYRHSLDASRNNVRSAWGGLLPTMDFNYSVSWNQGEDFEFGDLYGKNRSHRYGISIGLNLFDRFQTKRAISNARAALNTDEFSYHNYLNNLKLLVTQSYLNFEKASLSREVTRDKLASAQEDYKLAQEKYTLGAATILDLLDAEVSLKTAESDVIQSEYDLNLAVADLEKALGKMEY